MSDMTDEGFLALVAGGSGSGKSAYAEDLLLSLAGEEDKIYLATMRRDGPEALERIKRHERSRAGKGFVTLECPEGLVIKGDFMSRSSILLEDLPNLLANRMFSDGFDYSLWERPLFDPADGHVLHRMEDDPAGALLHQILKELQDLKRLCRHLVLVTDEIFSEGGGLSASMEWYLFLLGKMHQAIAKEATLVVEVVAGIPVAHKNKNEKGASCIFGH